MRTKRYLLAAGAALFGVFLLVSAISAYTLGGDAALTSPGNASANAARLTSEDGSFSFVSFPVPAGTTLNDLSTLQADYSLVAGNCGGGSPRFQIGVDTNGDATTDGRIFVYFGTPPGYNTCVAGWTASGNLLAAPVDATQLGLAFYESWANVLTTFGTKTITSISIAVDGSWVTNPQTFDFDNVNIDGVIETFEPLTPASADACKKGGWQGLTRADFSPFKNQGDCIQYVNTGK